MSGHSHWAQVKHKKAGSDAKRGLLFSKLTRLISAASREAGADPDANPKLRSAILQARSAGLPKDNIERAIKRGAGAGTEAGELYSVEYGAYGPGGAALLIRGLTDNQNRTTAEIKRLLSESEARLATTGSVKWLFEERMSADFPADAETGPIELLLIDAGAEDTFFTEGAVQALVRPESWGKFEASVKEKGLSPSSFRTIAVPKTRVSLEPDERERVLGLVEALEDHPDVTEVWTNLKGFDQNLEASAEQILETKP